jgi:hypothetical protein
MQHSAGSASALTIGNTSTGTGLITLTGDIGSGQAITSLTVEDDLNLAASVSTTGNQTFNDVVTLGSAVTLTTSTGNVQFDSTIDSDATARALTINAQSTTSGEGSVTFDGAVGATKLGTVDITGNAVTINQAFSSSNSIEISNAGLLTVADDAHIVADAGFTQNDAGLMSLGADITTVNTGISHWQRLDVAR